MNPRWRCPYTPLRQYHSRYPSSLHYRTTRSRIPSAAIANMRSSSVMIQLLAYTIDTRQHIIPYKATTNAIILWTLLMTLWHSSRTGIPLKPQNTSLSTLFSPACLHSHSQSHHAQNTVTRTSESTRTFPLAPPPDSIALPRPFHILHLTPHSITLTSTPNIETNNAAP